MFTSWKIAFRFLLKSKIQTLVIVLGIAIGVSVQIFIGLLSKGLEGTLLNKVVGNSSHVTVYSKKGGIENWQAKKEKIVKNSKIKAVCPMAEHQAFVKLKDMKKLVVVKGYIPKDMEDMYKITDKIYEGNMVKSDREVIIGKDLKERLGLKIGDKISIATVWGKKDSFKVTGFFDLGTIKLNKNWIITNLKTVQNLIGFGDKATSIEIGVNNPYEASEVSKYVDSVLNNNDLKVENWENGNKLLVSGMWGQKVCTVIIQFFVLLAAVLSIVSILGISVVQKYKQIGILKAMGIRDRTASFIFVVQAFVLGVLGTALGIYFTFLYIRIFNTYIVTPEGNPVVNIVVNKRFILLSGVIDVLASIFAAIYPAIKSFRLSAVEVIKNG